MDRTTDPQAGARWAPALRALGDERLARMVENGSEPAFTAIYGRYAPVLHGYCRSLLRDEEEAGDALQNAMLKALQAMRRSGRSGPLRPWLFRIAHNESVTIIRARGRRPGPLDESVVAGAGDAFRRAAAREQLAALLEDMQQLTEHQRGALVMRELGGLTYDEIGEALETTPLAARQAVFMARKRLRDGVVAPRRLRPALRGLIPAPGFALLGLFGTGGKALVGTAAVVSVGIGSVELAVEPPKPAPRRTVVAEATPVPSKTKVKPRKAKVAIAAATVRPAATVAPVRTAATAPKTTAAATPRVAVRRVSVTVTPAPTPTPSPTPAAKAKPEASATPAPSPTTVPVVAHPQRPAAYAAAAGGRWQGGHGDCPAHATPDGAPVPPMQ